MKFYTCSCTFYTCFGTIRLKQEEVLEKPIHFVFVDHSVDYRDHAAVITGSQVVTDYFA